MFILQRITLGAIPERQPAQQKSFNTLEPTATVPTAMTDVQRKYILCVILARGPNEYSIIVNTALLTTADHGTAAKKRVVTLF